MGAWQLRGNADSLSEYEGAVKKPSSCDRNVVKEYLSFDKDDPLSSYGDIVNDQLPYDRDVTKDQLSYDRDDVDDPLWSKKQFGKGLASPGKEFVNNPLLSDRDVLKCPLSSEEGTVPSAVECAEVFVKNSVLCNLNFVKNPLVDNMGHYLPCSMDFEEGSMCFKWDAAAHSDLCAMNHSLTCKVLRKSPGSGEVDLAEDSASCDMGHVKCTSTCKESVAVACEHDVLLLCEDDQRCGWRRRRRGVMWWLLLLLLLGAAPLASGELRPNTDISTTRAEGGKLYTEE